MVRTIQLAEIMRRIQQIAVAEGLKDVDRIAGELGYAIQRIEAELQRIEGEEGRLKHERPSTNSDA